MRRLRFGLSLKVLSVVTALMLVTFSVVTPQVVRGVTGQAKQSLINQSKSFGALATQPIGDQFLLYRDSGTTLLDERVDAYTKLFSAVSNVSIYNVLGEKQYALRDVSTELSRQEAESFEPIFVYSSAGYVEKVIYPWIEGNGVHRFTMVYDISRAEIEAIIARVSNGTIAAAAAVLVVVNIAILLLLEFMFIRPVNKISTLALTIGAGNYKTLIPIKRHDEIGDLAHSINKMSQTIQEDVDKLIAAEQLKSEFLIISSHNLRTPLTVVTGYTDLLKSMPIDDDAKKFVLQIEAKAKELTELTNDMLTVAELEGGGQPKLQLQKTDLVALLKEIGDELKKKTDAKSVQAEIVVPGSPVLINTQTTYLETALWNLLDNSLKFTPENGTITLSLAETDNAVSIAVKDTGAGISPEELPKLFTKFHRGTSLMQYQYEGVGLGLYMTKLMLDLLGGTIKAESTLGQESVFTITLPKS